MTWGDVLEPVREDEFVLDPTRLTLVCGTAGYDGTQFKGLLASEYEIQLNKTSRNSRPLPDEHQQHAQRRREPRQPLVEISTRRSTNRLAGGGEHGPGRVRRAGEVAHGGRAGPPELQPLPRPLPRGPVGRRRSRATCAAASTWRTTRTAASTCARRAPRSTARLKYGPGARLGELRDPLPAGLPDHGARAR